MSLRPILLAIVGDSAAGKSTLGAGIAALLGDERVTVVTTDDYHKHNRKARRELRLSALHPDCNDLDLLGEHLEQLANGNAVEKAPYNHSTGDFDAPRADQAVGISDRRRAARPALARAARPLRCDVCISTRRSRCGIAGRSSRDTAKRGYSEAQVQELLERRERCRRVHPPAARACRHGGALPPGPKAIDDTKLHATVAMRDQLTHPALPNGARGVSAALRRGCCCGRGRGRSARDRRQDLG